MILWWPLVGSILAVPTVWGLCQERSPRTLIVFASGVGAFVGVSFWPPSNTIVLDHWLGIPGIGRPIADMAIVVGTICHYLFASWDKEEWTRAHIACLWGWRW